MTEEVKMRWVSIRLSDGEYKTLSEIAKKNKTSVSSYIRNRILHDDETQSGTYTPFEYKAIRGLTYCIGALECLTSAKLNSAQKDAMNAKVAKVMELNGIDISQTNYFKRKNKS